ncbi:MAG: radical SAM protein [Candidatus Krumholzibacteriota bacterium]|nr:radical SAM protein [Candidatus Krumholzibacteriota bacterium]
MIDRFGREIDYLRISVTDRCNYRCVYCMPESGISLKPHESILDFESIAAIASAAAGLGIVKIRLTGGEPLVRKGIGTLTKMLGDIDKIKELTMTTNAVFLTDEMAETLREAGLIRINISLDTLDPVRFAEITRGGDIADVLKGIESAKKSGFDPVKINMIVFSETTAEEVEEMRGFCLDRGLVLQTIKHFSLYNRDKMIGDVDLFDRPAPCSECNRIRLTADGFLKPCLFSDKEIRVDMNNIEKSILEAVSGKPFQGTACCNRSMYQIGG